MPTPPQFATIGPIWLVGCGNLGRAMLDGWLRAGVPARALTVINPSPRNLPQDIGYLSAPKDGLPTPAILVLAVKPTRLGEVALSLALWAPGSLVISVLAGAKLARLAALFPHSRVIRALPNTPARIGQGTTLLAADRPCAADVATATALMSALGATHWIDEAIFDAATAIAASSPAWLFRWTAALGHAGAVTGVDPALAVRLASEAMAGSAAYALGAGRTLDDLAREVASPGGMTQAGLDRLDSGGALERLLLETVAAAVDRAAVLAREADDDPR